MTDSPPPGLPPTYRDVWRRVHAEARTTASRARLASRLGVSTHTLQRILVDGRAPDFRHPQSRRLTLSWVRTLANLAARLDADPRRWIVGVGIDWDEQVASTAARVRRKVGLASRPEERTAPSPVLGAIRARAAAGDPTPVTAARVTRVPFTDPLPGTSRSFFHRLIERLVGSIHPGWGIRWRDGSPSDLVAELAAPTPRLNLAIGIFESARLRARGIRFLPLPGWDLPFGGLWLGPARADAPTWTDLATTPDLTFLVREEEPGPAIVRQWDVPPDSVEACDAPDETALAEALRARARARRSGAVLVTDLATISRVRRSIPDPDAEHRAAIVRADRPPRYPLAIATPAGDPRWSELLEVAWRRELLGALRVETAGLYADLVAGTVESTTAPASAGAGPGAAAALEHFPGATPEFAQAFTHRLLAVLRDRAPGGRDWLHLARLAAPVVPSEWHGALQASASELRRRPEEKRSRYCQSCSTSLLEFGGVSDAYCRYCADDEGHLKSREEVHRLIAEWMRGWQAGLGEEESYQRATRFMSVMPAWSEN